MSKLSKTQIISTITLFISGVAYFVGDLGGIWGFSGVGEQIQQTCASFAVAAGMILGANTVFKNSNTTTKTDEEKGVSDE